MITKRRLKNIAKQIYPHSEFSRKERKELRKITIDDMLEYLDNHPNTSYDELQERYIVNKYNADNNIYFHITVYIIIIAVIVAVLSCVLIYLASIFIQPVTYYI